MKLKIEYINEDTSEKLILKNRDGKVYYHSSRIHDPREFEPLLTFLENNKDLDTYDKVYDKVKSLSHNIRTRREYYYYDSIIELLDKI